MTINKHTLEKSCNIARVKRGGRKWLTNVPPSQSALGNDCNTGKMSPKS